MLFALGFIVTFLNGGLTGLFLGNVVVDVPLSDTMFVVAHFHMVMGVAPILVIFGAIYHWYPKVTGRMLNDRIGQVPLLGHVPRCLCDLLPDALSRPAGYAAPLSRYRRNRFIPASAHDLNAFISIVALIVGFAQMVFVFNLVWSLFRGKEAGPNLWHATTLEWQNARDAASTWQLGEGTSCRLSLGL